MTRYLPICLNLENRPVRVFGAGRVATERIQHLVELGARVSVIAPQAGDGVRELAERGEIRLELRRYAPGDTAGAFLVLAATDDPSANAAIHAEAEAAGTLVNVCDDPPHCNYIFASRVERGPLTLAIFTHGTSPALSRRVRRELEGWLGPEYGELAELLAELRPRVQAIPGLSPEDRQRIFERIVYSETLLLFREGRREEASARARELLADELRLLGRDAQVDLPEP